MRQPKDVRQPKNVKHACEYFNEDDKELQYGPFPAEAWEVTFFTRNGYDDDTVLIMANGVTEALAKAEEVRPVTRIKRMSHRDMYR